jgi:hypothetical protein
VQQQRLLDLAADAVGGIEREFRILQISPMPLPRRPFQRRRSKRLSNPDARRKIIRGLDLGAARQEPHDRPSGQRFARSGFADQRHNLTADVSDTI